MPAAATDSLPAALAERLGALAEARAGLIEALGGPDEPYGLDQSALARRPPASGEPGTVGEDMERWSIRDVLWHVGDAERSWVDWAEAALRGEAATRLQRTRRPAHRNRMPQLLAWIEERRAATLAAVSGIDQQVLATRHATPDGASSILELLDQLARHDRAHTAHVVALRALPVAEDR